ncbi:tautomerase family protein [Campylobacter upsaliensis]|uniref:4-oxalocrotonate tautomerase n=1 Tax=Campylobacter upsaliensis TaxID=28080 RepID=A0A381EJT5_CAMUP|nr:4-oxalocrotonate tautomerase family protein [Campylobacter upsaliensis]MCR2100340.1 4-oxalocrotonate tautomerase family protein [Campylobacter upsaliensis]SUX27258.1 4-oxalocrotonate tautomerase [Campylobacter upsaliensis]
MPIVNIKLAKPALSKEQKAELIADVSELLSTKYHKAKERIVVMIEDVEPYDIGFNGESMESIKKRMQQ